MVIVKKLMNNNSLVQKITFSEHELAVERRLRCLNFRRGVVSVVVYNSPLAYTPFNDKLEEGSGRAGDISL